MFGFLSYLFSKDEDSEWNEKCRSDSLDFDDPCHDYDDDYCDECGFDDDDDDDD